MKMQMSPADFIGASHFGVRPRSHPSELMLRLHFHCNLSQALPLASKPKPCSDLNEMAAMFRRCHGGQDAGSSSGGQPFAPDKR